MFIIERRTAGVLAALVTPAAVALLSSVWDRLGEIANPASSGRKQNTPSRTGSRNSGPPQGSD